MGDIGGWFQAVRAFTQYFFQRTTGKSPRHADHRALNVYVHVHSCPNVKLTPER